MPRLPGSALQPNHYSAKAGRAHLRARRQPRAYSWRVTAGECPLDGDQVGDDIDGLCWPGGRSG